MILAYFHLKPYDLLNRFSIYFDNILTPNSSNLDTSYPKSMFFFEINF